MPEGDGPEGAACPNVEKGKNIYIFVKPDTSHMPSNVNSASINADSDSQHGKDSNWGKHIVRILDLTCLRRGRKWLQKLKNWLN